jgi:2-desacetyl-2-hydroxyethyl bacteriochlorophyllide A dehydrogenase
MNAQAVVFTAPNQVEFCPVTCPEPGPGDVVVHLTYSWISNGTEGSFLRGERIAGDTPYRPGDPWPFPIVAGYQKVGVVEWIGADVADLHVGETVFATMGKIDGMFMPLGGHVSPSVSPREQIWKLPPGVGGTLGALAVSGLVLTQDAPAHYPPFSCQPGCRSLAGPNGKRRPYPSLAQARCWSRWLR